MFLPIVAGIAGIAATGAALAGGAAMLTGAIAGGMALHKHFSTPPPPPPSLKTCDQLPDDKVCKQNAFSFSLWLYIPTHIHPPPVQEEMQIRRGLWWTQRHACV
jgi:disulfide bond formation protein DsbB